MASTMGSASLRSGAFRSAAFRSTPPAGLQQLRRSGAQPSPVQRRVLCRAVDAEALSAVTQQAIAYAVVLGAEGAFSTSQIPEGDKGRPQIPLVAAGVGGTLASVALVSVGSGSSLSVVGLAVGLLTSAAMFAVCVRRTLDLQYNDGDWPGEWRVLAREDGAAVYRHSRRRRFLLLLPLTSPNNTTTTQQAPRRGRLAWG